MSFLTDDEVLTPHTGYPMHNHYMPNKIKTQIQKFIFTTLIFPALSSRSLFGPRKNVSTFLWVNPPAPRSYLLIVIPVLDTGNQVIISYFL